MYKPIWPIIIQISDLTWPEFYFFLFISLSISFFLFLFLFLFSFSLSIYLYICVCLYRPSPSLSPLSFSLSLSLIYCGNAWGLNMTDREKPRKCHDNHLGCVMFYIIFSVLLCLPRVIVCKYNKRLINTQIPTVSYMVKCAAISVKHLIVYKYLTDTLKHPRT